MVMLLVPSAARGQTQTDPNPKLVLAISIDQFRQDFLRRFEDHFGEGGFNLLRRQGAEFTNAHYEHAATKTGAGHAVILSGTYAKVNGIIANEWYDVEKRKEVYCVQDSSSPLLGVDMEGRSPHNFAGLMVGDVQKLANPASKVITVSSKDRAAILMGGKLADAAYWREDTLFVSSTYYQDQLPGWVQAFNREGHVTGDHGRTWERLLPAEVYQTVGPDDVAHEDGSNGMGRTFPHPIDGGSDEIDDSFLEAFGKSPYSLRTVESFAERAIVKEKLGQRGATDLLAISLSANDKVGHAYGPYSQEVMDITVRTDRILKRLFDFVDKKVGLENVVIVLTSDHGVAPIPEVLQSRNSKVNARRYHPREIRGPAEEALTEAFGAPRTADSWILYHDNPNLYLNPEVLSARDVAFEEAEQVVKQRLVQLPEVHSVYTHSELQEGIESGQLATNVANSFYSRRTGHIFYVNKPYYLEDDEELGTSHGTSWNYDTHVPLLWYGGGIQPGTYRERVSVADIAPTLSQLLGIEQPAGTSGVVLREMLR